MWRPVNDWEKRLLIRLLAGDFPGFDALRSQIDSAQVMWEVPEQGQTQSEFMLFKIEGNDHDLTTAIVSAKSGASLKSIYSGFLLRAVFDFRM